MRLQGLLTQRRHVGPTLVLACIGILGLGAGTAVAAVTDNLIPNSLYHPSCISTTIGNGSPCQTDNAAVSYYMDSGGAGELEAADRTAVQNTMVLDYNPTDLTVTYDSTPVFSGSGETDIIYSESATGVPATADGTYWCNGAGSGSWECDQGYVRIRGGGHYTRGLSCHETGHAVGLLHGANADPRLSQTDSRLGCLMTPVGASVSLGSNNRDNINVTY